MSENRIVIESLASYLKTEIPELQDVIEEWPNNGEDLQYPSLSIFTVDAKEVHRPPVIHKQEELEDGTLKVQYKVGQLNYSLQLDAWCSNKVERGEIYQKIMDAFNKDFIENEGNLQLTITLENYYGILAHYEILGYSYVSEPQVGNWRIRFTVNGDFEKIKEVIRPKINDIVLVDEIGDSVEIE